MARYHGAVGFAETTETAPGVWENTIVERRYFGDVIRNIRRMERAETLNDNVVINNSISIVADPYAFQHFFNIRYLTWDNLKWKVTTVTVERPRLILEIGAVYNGNETTTA